MQRAPLLRNPDYNRPEVLSKFIPFVYAHVRTADDIHRAGKGVFHPEARDYAQRFRAVLLPKLAEADGVDVTTALASLAHDDVMRDVRDWILDLMDQRLKRAADLAPWTPDDLRSFAERHEVDPKTDSEPFSISVKRLRDIKNDIERADNSLRTELRPNDREAELRKWLQRKLRERSRQRYTVPQEEEIDLQERPDLRVERPGMGPVSIEVKWAERWTLEQLLERLENQLVGQYLRAHDSRYGIYVLGTIAHREYWVEPNGGAHLTFEEVIDAVTMRARDLAKASPQIGDLAVISLDFRQPQRT